MNIKTILFTSSALFAGVASASAADAIVYEEPAPLVETAPAFSWSGAYIGGQIGYGWGKSDYDDDFNVKPDGFLGGVYAGYNFDLGNNFVLGIDGDITYNGLKDRHHDIEELDFLDGDEEPDEFFMEGRLRWSGAVRARVGVAFDRFMPYVAGGVAFGNIKNTAWSVDGEHRVSASKTMTGWTIGGGVDYAATDNVILRLEYRYTDYGKKDFDFGGEELLGDKFKTHDVRLGVAYKF